MKRFLSADALSVMGAVAVGCLVMGWMDAVVQPGYLVKSLCKLALFLLLPWLCRYRRHPAQFKRLFALQGLSLRPLLLGPGVYGGILLLYIGIGRFFDFTQVVGALDRDLGVGPGNFWLVSLYIALVNSLLEEFFFRGFGYLALRESLSRPWAHLFSALSFALYHVAMLVGWFRLDLLSLLIALLVCAGLFLSWLDEKSRTLYPSWLVHMFANLAINTVGFLLFGLL